jgi:hypothetical protein
MAEWAWEDLIEESTRYLDSLQPVPEEWIVAEIYTHLGLLGAAIDGAPVHIADVLRMTMRLRIMREASRDRTLTILTTQQVLPFTTSLGDVYEQPWSIAALMDTVDLAEPTHTRFRLQDEASYYKAFQGTCVVDVLVKQRQGDWAFSAKHFHNAECSWRHVMDDIFELPVVTTYHENLPPRNLFFVVLCTVYRRHSSRCLNTRKHICCV